MSRLPTPGGDSSNWGTILNDFLSQEHNPDGTLIKSDLINGAQQKSEKAQANGYAPLDSGNKVPSINLPPAITPPDADTVTKGLIQLTGDLGGSAASPNVPMLSNKVDTSDSRLSNARLTVKKNGLTLPGGVESGTRKNLNFLDGSNVTITATDNGSDTVDLTVTGATPAPTIQDTLVDAKGDLVVATAADAPASFSSGTDGQALVADSSTTSGLAWTTLVSNSHTIQKDGAATTQRPIIDFEGGSASDDPSGTRTRIFVAREYLNVTDPRIGIVMQGGGGGGGNQGPKLQTAIDLAATSSTEGCVYIPPGTITLNQEIVFPDTASVRLLGAGNSDFGSPTGIFFTTDLGAGKYAFKLSSVVKHYLENFVMSGPGNPATPVGTIPAQTYGLYCPGPCLVKNVSLGSFGAAVGVKGAGQEWRSCSFTGNGYGMDWLDNPSGTTGNQLIERCFFTSNTLAGIAIADSNSMINVRFKGNGHFGQSPFGIYRYANTNGSTRRAIAMQNVVFENWSFEGCGNATIYDEPGDGLWKNIVFDSPAEASTFAFQKWPGKPTNLASIDIGYAEGFHWREGGWSYWPPHPQISARSFTNIRVDGGDVPKSVLLSPSTSRPITLKSEGVGGTEIDGFQISRRAKGTTASSGSVRIAEEAIAQYDLVELTSNGHVRTSRNGAGSLIVGISCGDYAAGEVCVFVTQGDIFYLNCKNQSGVTLQQGKILKPDPNHAGCVMMAANPSDGPIIGRVNDAAIPNNSHGRLMLIMN